MDLDLKPGYELFAPNIVDLASGDLGQLEWTDLTPLSGPSVIRVSQCRKNDSPVN